MHTTGVCPHPSARSQSPSKPAIISDYDRTFLPFSIPAHVTLAPHNRFDRDEASKEFVCNQLDDSFRRVTEEAEVEIDRSRSSTRTVNFTELCNISMSRRGRRGYDRQLPTSNEVNSQLGSRTSLLPALKYIYFHQDIRVPYIGTYTKLPLYRPLCSLGRNPFQRLRPDTCYEEDSEAEWEEPGEGEDLLSEADDDNSGNEEDEMEDFLDDEDDPGLQRRGAVKGELVPVCSGICWEDSNSTRDQGVIHLHRMDILLEGITGGIDPYSTTYWAAEPSSMGPPPAPLVRQPSRVSPAMHEVSASTSGPTPGAVPASLRGKPLIDAHLMEDFKKEVDGSDMTKIAMVEHLKKR